MDAAGASPKATLKIATGSGWKAYAWDASKTGLTGESLTPKNGQITLMLDGSPRIFLED